MSRPSQFRIHPLTGDLIFPIGTNPRTGALRWPIMGGSGDGGDGGGDAGGDAGAGDAGAGGQGGDAGADNGGDGDKGTDLAELIRSDPKKAQAEIERLRKENASARVNNKGAAEEAGKKAAEEARKAALDEVAKALGLKEGDKAPSIDELTKQLTEQTTKTEQAAAVARDTQAELVVWQNATTLGVDAQALTDSRAFAAAIKDLDPTDAKFAEDVKKAAQEAVEKNPKLKATQGAGSSSADHGGTGGGTNSKTPQSLTAAVGGHYGT